MSEHTPPNPVRPVPGKKVVRIKLVPIDPASPPEAMGPLKPPAPACVSTRGAVVALGDGDGNPRPEPAAIPVDAEHERLPVENINAALARQQAERAKSAAANAAAHVTLAAIEAKAAAFCAARAAWHALLYKGPAMVKTSVKIAYDVFVKVVADVVREAAMGERK